MKVLFLDFDGVLNSERWYDQLPPREANYFQLPYEERRARYIDPTCVDRVNHVIEQTGAAVVVTSSWRGMDAATLFGLPPAPKELERILKRVGFRHTLTGQTPDLSEPELKDGPHAHEPVRLLRAVTRWEEIRRWTILWNQDVREKGYLPHYIVKSFAVVDDDDVASQGCPPEFFVRTSHATGLTDSDVERIVKILGVRDANERRYYPVTT
jgi:hypothetical protein